MDLRPASEQLLGRSVSWRQGVTLAVNAVPGCAADPPIANWAVRSRPVEDVSTSGGAGWTDEAARLAALGEAIERYAPQTTHLPTRDAAEVPDGEPVVTDFVLPRGASLGSAFSPVWSLRTNQRAWVPTALLGSAQAMTTSSGLAADPDPHRALLRALQELVERDALMRVWAEGTALPQRPMPDRLREFFTGSDAVVLDATPAHSPHPVAIVAGNLPLAGRPRNAVGLACRADWESAVDKAALEWAQSVVFAGVSTAQDQPGATFRAEDVHTFDDHARFYTRRPDLWARLPWFGGTLADQPRRQSPPEGDAAQLQHLVTALEDAGHQCFYFSFDTPDVRGCGMRAVRVLATGLVPIHADHAHPALPSWPADRPHPLG